MNKESIIFNLHPDYQFDSEKTWNDLVDFFKISFQNQDISGMNKSLSQIKYYITTAKAYLNPKIDIEENIILQRKRCTMILGPLFDLTTTIPFIDLHL